MRRKIVYLEKAMTSSVEEMVEIVDQDNHSLGGRTRGQMRAEGLTHRATYVLVMNHEDQFFVQKRTTTKDIYPGYWDLAAGGVVQAGESYEEAAARELREELGIGGELTFLFDHYYQDNGNKVWGRVFLCRHHGPFLLQESEIEYGRFMGVDEVQRLGQQEALTPDGIEILEKFLRHRHQGPRPLFFLHGLDSSGQGTKGRFFSQHFPHILRPDFSGNLEERMARLTELCGGGTYLTLIGSSFGGLMAVIFATRHPDRLARLILLAPALNYGDYHPPRKPLTIPTTLIIGKDDTVTPPDLVLPLASATFADLNIQVADDDHLLHRTFPALPWYRLLLP
jgi:8-oxo-dGTP pyrophosphatase MutT (NUDIX family)